MKKLVILFATILMMILFAMSVSAKEIVKSGNCGANGDNVTYVLYDDGELVISGSGAMKNYIEYDYSPWSSRFVKNVAIKEGVTTVGDFAFYMNKNIENVVISDSVETIGEGAFYSCYNLLKIRLGNNLSLIGRNSFRDCISLSSIIIPDSVISINDDAFRGCTDLCSVVLGNRVESIGRWAFYYCDSLQKIVIGNNVTYIGDYAFDFCKFLKYIYYLGTYEQWKNINIGYGGNDFFKDAIRYYSVLTDVIEPTCTENGVGTYTGAIPYTVENKYFLTHDLGYEKVISEATCITNGEKRVYCSRCEYYEIIELPAFGHNHILVNVTSSTHLENGVKTYICNCGDTYTESVPKLEEHSYEKTITPPTCTTRGYTTYTCECGDKYIGDYKNKLNHTYTSSVTTEPTHLEEGVRTYTCECTDTYTESIPKLTGHTYEESITDPTCTEKGYTTYMCECGDTSINNYTDAKGHSFTNYISDGKATCSTNGLKIAKCDNCDATDSIVISGDHSFSNEWTIDEEPTCKEEGMKSHHCKYCSARKDFTPIGKLAHDFVTVRVEPTCLDEGYTITACKCGEEIIEPIAPTGHDYDGSKCNVCDYDRADDCSCNCHKGGIMGFFWKIINFFNKLFKNNQQCKCGMAHY